MMQHKLHFEGLIFSLSLGVIRVVVLVPCDDDVKPRENDNVMLSRPKNS